MEKNLIRNYKDTVFRMIFNDRKELLSLYNAVNNTDYKNADELEIVTLENAVYLSMKNDVSCVLDMRLQIYEQQSSINPNMPLRDLMYITRQYEKLIVGKDIYSSKLIRLPSPRFIVFYNGKDKQPEKKMLILSDAFEKKGEDINLELKVLQININKGYNEDIKKRCPKLFHYMSYVDEVRKNLEIYPLELAVPKAIDYCISNDILKDFLLANKAEVVSMSIFEYDEELHKKTLLQEGYEEGYDIGLSDGIEQGIEQGRKESREEIERLKMLLAEKEKMLS